MIILEDINFQWDQNEIDRTINMWMQGSPIQDISKELNREGDEVFLLLLHLARHRKIKVRNNYVWGIPMPEGCQYANIGCQKGE